MRLIEKALILLSEEKNDFKTLKALLDSFDYTNSIYIEHANRDIGFTKPNRKEIEEYIKKAIKYDFLDQDYMSNDGQDFKVEYNEAVEMFFKLITKSLNKYYIIETEIKSGSGRKIVKIQPKIRDSYDRYGLVFKTLKNKIDSKLYSEYKEYYESYTSKKI